MSPLLTTFVKGKVRLGLGKVWVKVRFGSVWLGKVLFQYVSKIKKRLMNRNFLLSYLINLDIRVVDL
jgi:hypothetical protein